MNRFSRTDSENKSFQDLIVLLDEYLKVTDGDEHSFYAQFNKTVNIHHVIICYVDNRPVACGAFKEYDQHTVEIKRMFVLADFRGRGIGQDVLRELELWASELKYSTCILETGKKQYEAIRLYENAGYKRIKNYGQYENVENSVCMNKNIAIATL